MKTPFRLQVSEYDCVPTTFINAISALFEREKIPADVVKHIYLYSLDTVDKAGKTGRGGTTWFSIQLLGNWLNSRKSKIFPIITEYICGNNIHLRQNNKIVKCLNQGGVALCNISLGADFWHYVLGLKADQHSLYFFDPYPEQKSENIELLETDYFSPNLLVARYWLDQYQNEAYCFGKMENRQCLLMWRE